MGSPLRFADPDGTLVDSYGYDEFGADLYDNQGLSQPFGFTGYAADGVSGTYFAQAREYDPRSSRMLSPDPHWDLGNMIYGDRWYAPAGAPVPDIGAMAQSGAPYIYAMNNPIRYIDPTGSKAGDKFTSSREAAIDWARENYGFTKYTRMEMHSYMLITWEEDADGNTSLYYTYTKASLGGFHAISGRKIYRDMAEASGAVVVGEIHSHPGGGAYGFSPHDKHTAERLGYPVYVVAPGKDGVYINKYFETREGYKEISIARNIKFKPLSQVEKDIVKERLQEKWDEHIKESHTCKCGNKAWPNEDNKGYSN
jgi:RHS repeat-associated protein